MDVDSSPVDAAEDRDGDAQTEGGTTSAQCQRRACPTPVDDAPSAPVVSFREDILPVIQRNCSDNPCHGQAVTPFLGPPLPEVPDADEVLARIVGVPSETAPSMMLVVPGDPAASFFVLKVEGCHTMAGLDCTPLPGVMSNEPCGDPMPQAARPICDEDRRLLQRWVLQGALNN